MPWAPICRSWMAFLACALPSGHRMPAAFRSWATSISGMRAVTPCAGISAPGCGICSSLACRLGRSTSMTCSARAARPCRRRQTRSPGRPRCRPRQAQSSRARRSGAGRTGRGWHGAAPHRRWTLPSPPMRCMPAPGCLPPRQASRGGRRWRTGWRLTAPGWASPTSSCCRSWSIHSAGPGATSRSASMRRARGSVRRRASPTSWTAAMPWAWACCWTGCRRTSRRTRTAWPCSTAPRCMSMPTRAKGSTPTGTPTSTTSAATRSVGS